MTLTITIHFCNVVYFVNILFSVNMSFFQQAYEFIKLFRDIEKLTIKCIHLKCGIEYIYNMSHTVFMLSYKSLHKFFLIKWFERALLELSL